MKQVNYVISPTNVIKRIANNCILDVSAVFALKASKENVIHVKSQKVFIGKTLTSISFLLMEFILGTSVLNRLNVSVN